MKEKKIDRGDSVNKLPNAIKRELDYCMKFLTDNHCLAVANFITENDFDGDVYSLAMWMLYRKKYFEYILKIARRHYMNTKFSFRTADVLSAMFVAYMYGVPEEVLSKWFKILTLGDYDKKEQPYARQIISLRDLILDNEIDCKSLKDRYREHKENFYITNFKRCQCSIYNYWKKKRIGKIEPIEVFSCELKEFADSLFDENLL